MDRPASNKMADSHEIRPLTGIRGIASAWVVCRHYWEAWILILPGVAWFKLLFARGDFAVDIFFILSGFILSYVYSAGDRKFGLSEYGKFIWFRFARIYPVHAATLGILGALTLAAFLLHIKVTGLRPISHLPFQITLTQVWPYVPGIQGGEWNGPSWSISAEWFAYIFLFPGIAYVLREEWNPLVLLALAYSVMGVWIFCPAPICYYLPVSINLLKAICEFIIGGLFFGVYLHHEPITRFCRKYATVFAVILAILIAFLKVQNIWLQCLTLPLVPLLLVGLTSEQSWVGWFLSTRFSLWLGKVSYALYMGHEIVLQILKILLPWNHYVHSGLAVRLLVFGANIVAILIFTVVLHYWIEVPARNYLRKVRPWDYFRRQEKLPVTGLS